MIAAPKRKSNTGLTIVLVAVAMVAFCCGFSVLVVALNSGGNHRPSGDGDRTVQAATTAIGPNQPGRDGKFEFVVTNVECGRTQLGGSFLSKKAQGQFCLVSVTVKNIGDEPRTFSASNQRAFNAAGQRYDADGSAGLYLEQDSRAFLEDINPGNSVNGTVVFDIPTDQQIQRLELHDSAFSGGVTITVA